MILITVYWMAGNRSKSEFLATSWEVDTVHNHLIVREPSGSTFYIERANVRYFITDAVREE
jgi:hypothetical protein